METLIKRPRKFSSEHVRGHETLAENRHVGVTCVSIGRPVFSQSLSRCLARSRSLFQSPSYFGSFPGTNHTSKASILGSYVYHRSSHCLVRSKQPNQLYWAKVSFSSLFRRNKASTHPVSSQPCTVSDNSYFLLSYPHVSIPCFLWLLFSQYLSVHSVVHLKYVSNIFLRLLLPYRGSYM